MLAVAFGQSTMSRTQVQLWYNRFKEDQEYVNDDPRPGPPSTTTTDENIEAVKKMILDNRRITTLMLAQMLTTFNDYPDLLVTNYRCVTTTLKPKPNNPNGSVQKCQDRKQHVKFGKM